MRFMELQSNHAYVMYTLLYMKQHANSWGSRWYNYTFSYFNSEDYRTYYAPSVQYRKIYIVKGIVRIENHNCENETTSGARYMLHLRVTRYADKY